jgi:hypothetical protein
MQKYQNHKILIYKKKETREEMQYYNNSFTLENKA